MRVAVAALLFGSTTTRGRLLAEAPNYESQGFAGEQCNTKNVGAGCQRFYRCAYKGAEFVLAQRAQRIAQLEEIQRQNREDLQAEVLSAKTQLDQLLADAIVERQQLREQLNQQRDEQNVDYDDLIAKRQTLDDSLKGKQDQVYSMRKQINDLTYQDNKQIVDGGGRVTYGKVEDNTQTTISNGLSTSDKNAALLLMENYFKNLNKAIDKEQLDNEVEWKRIKGTYEGQSGEIGQAATDPNETVLRLRDEVDQGLQNLDAERGTQTVPTPVQATAEQNVQVTGQGAVTGGEGADGEEAVAASGFGVCVIEDACGTTINNTELVCQSQMIAAATSILLALAISSV